jgi:hypothetical protein
MEVPGRNVAWLIKKLAGIFDRKIWFDSKPLPNGRGYDRRRDGWGALHGKRHYIKRSKTWPERPLGITNGNACSRR